MAFIRAVIPQTSKTKKAEKNRLPVYRCSILAIAHCQQVHDRHMDLQGVQESVQCVQHSVQHSVQRSVQHSN